MSSRMALVVQPADRWFSLDFNAGCWLGGPPRSACQVPSPGGHRGGSSKAVAASGAAAAFLAARRHPLRRGRSCARPRRAVEAVAPEALSAPLRRLDDFLERAVAAEVAGEAEAVVGAEADAQAVIDRDLQGLLRGFGAAEQLPKREFTLQELKEKGVEAQRLLSPEDTTLDAVRKGLLLGVTVLGTVLIFTLHPSVFDLIRIVAAGLLALLVDQVVSRGVLELLLVDSIARKVDPEYPVRVSQHEAGHFLVAYLMGLLPKAYTLSSLDALVRYQSPSVQAGCIFCDAAFRREVETGSISSRSLDRFTCVALGGVAAEYLRFGQARGGLTDIQQLEGILQGLGFDQRRASAQVRWSVLNTVGLLRRHADVHLRLAEAMADGAAVGECVALVERGLASSE